MCLSNMCSAMEGLVQDPCCTWYESGLPLFFGCFAYHAPELKECGEPERPEPQSNHATWLCTDLISVAHDIGRKPYREGSSHVMHILKYIQHYDCLHRTSLIVIEWGGPFVWRTLPIGAVILQSAN